jgi:hypothetical protein
MSDILETLKAEIEEGIEILRPHYPIDADLRTIAEYWRPQFYQRGRWPTAEEIEVGKARLAEVGQGGGGFAL